MSSHIPRYAEHWAAGECFIPVSLSFMHYVYYGSGTPSGVPGKSQKTELHTFFFFNTCPE